MVHETVYKCHVSHHKCQKILENGYISTVNTVLYLFHLLLNKYQIFPSHSEQQANNIRKYLALPPLGLLSNHFLCFPSLWISDKLSDTITGL